MQLGHFAGIHNFVNTLHNKPVMAALFIATLLSILVFGYGAKGSKGKSNYTVTEECWFEIEIKDHDGPGEDYRGRFVIGLFGETAPMTSMNFAALTKGFTRGNKETLRYKGSKIHRVVPDFLIQMGDVTVGDGTGGKSIYSDKFVDENFIISHAARGTVSMANHGKDTNGSQFFILLNKARWLDGKHVAFGKVIQGMDVVETIGEVQTEKDTAVPRKTIKIVDCGINEIGQKYDLSEEQFLSDTDI